VGQNRRHPTFTERARPADAGAHPTGCWSSICGQADSDEQAEGPGRAICEPPGDGPRSATISRLLRHAAAAARLFGGPVWTAAFEVLEEVLASQSGNGKPSIAVCKSLLTGPGPRAGEDLRSADSLLFRLARRGRWRPAAAALLGRKQLGKKWLKTDVEEIVRDWQEHAPQAAVARRYVAYLRCGRPAIARCLALLQQHPAAGGEASATNVRFFFCRSSCPVWAQSP